MIFAHYRSCGNFRKIVDMRVFLVFAVFALLLSGCVMADRPTLSPEARASLRLTRAEVVLEPSANIHVSPVEDEASARGGTREQIAEAQRNHVREVLASEFMNIVAPRLAGERPVFARITVGQFFIPGPVYTLLVAGSSNFSAGVDLIDVRTGETLISIPPGKIQHTVFRPGGMIGFVAQAATAGDPVDSKSREISKNFANEFLAWLSAS
jgi:hypothetical protein